MRLRLPRCHGAAFALAAAWLLSPLCAPAAAAGHSEAAFARHPLAGHVAEAAARFGIPERWIWSVMRAESAGNPRAVSPAGAQGLMQIMPGTWAMLAPRFGLGSDPFDPRANIHGGAAYLRLMWDRYRSPALMLAAYNAGPGRADAWATGRRGLPAETIDYVARILPEIGQSGTAPSSARSARAAALSWRSAALFPGATAAAPAIASGARLDGASAARSTLREADEADDDVPAPHPLFLPLSGRDR